MTQTAAPAAHALALAAILDTLPARIAHTPGKPGGKRLPHLRDIVIAACNGVCVVCGKREAKELGHIVPANGDACGYVPGNIAGMCKPCNKAIANNTPNWRAFANVAGILTEWPPLSGKYNGGENIEDVTAELIAAGIL